MGYIRNYLWAQGFWIGDKIYPISALKGMVSCYDDYRGYLSDGIFISIPSIAGLLTPEAIIIEEGEYTTWLKSVDPEGYMAYKKNRSTGEN